MSLVPRMPRSLPARSVPPDWTWTVPTLPEPFNVAPLATTALLEALYPLTTSVPALTDVSQYRNWCQREPRCPWWSCQDGRAGEIHGNRTGLHEEGSASVRVLVLPLEETDPLEDPLPRVSVPLMVWLFPFISNVLPARRYSRKRWMRSPETQGTGVDHGLAAIVVRRVEHHRAKTIFLKLTDTRDKAVQG